VLSAILKIMRSVIHLLPSFKFFRSCKKVDILSDKIPEFYMSRGSRTPIYFLIVGLKSILLLSVRIIVSDYQNNENKF